MHCQLFQLLPYTRLKYCMFPLICGIQLKYKYICDMKAEEDWAGGGEQEMEKPKEGMGEQHRLCVVFT